MILFFLFSVAFFSYPVLAAQSKTVEIFADTFEMDIDTKTSYFRKNVRIRFDPYQATCHQAIVYMDAKTQKVLKVVMSGQVTVKREGSLFKGQTVTLDIQNNKLAVQGQVYTRIQTSEFKNNLR